MPRAVVLRVTDDREEAGEGAIARLFGRAEFDAPVGQHLRPQAALLRERTERPQVGVGRPSAPVVDEQGADGLPRRAESVEVQLRALGPVQQAGRTQPRPCLLYTSDAADE